MHVILSGVGTHRVLGAPPVWEVDVVLVIIELCVHMYVNFHNYSCTCRQDESPIVMDLFRL